MDTLAPTEALSAAGQKKRRLGWNEYTPTIVLFLFPTIFFISVFVLWPIISSFRLSLFKWNGIAPTKEMVGLDNWSQLLHDDVFWKAFKNNLTVVVLSIAIQMPIGMTLAMMLENAGRFFVAKIFKTVYFFPMLMSSVAIGILWKYIYDPSFGLVNGFLREVGLNAWAKSWLGEPTLALYAVIAVICWQYTPFYMILFLAALTGIPEELRDASLIDGANERQYYLRIALPLVRGTVRVAIILSLVGSLKYFDLIWVMTEGGPSNASELMATYMYKKAFPSFEMGYGSTVAALFFIIVMIMSVSVFLLSRRFETEV
jgi:raffinose/stachyose/melibiose transport system permease protein